MFKRVLIPVGVALAIILTFVLSLNVLLPRQQEMQDIQAIRQFTSNLATSHSQAYALVSVDINPSFEIYVDIAGIVLEIEAVNDDARTLGVSTLIGLPVEDAISGIIQLATQAGFIQPDDITDDYVIVSTVILDEDDEDNDENHDSLDEHIEAGLGDDTELGDTITIAVLKASLREFFEARGKDIPLGLYIINGMIESDGQLILISEFVSNPDNVNALMDRAIMIAFDDDEDETEISESDEDDDDDDEDETEISESDDENDDDEDETEISESDDENDDDEDETDISESDDENNDDEDETDISESDDEDDDDDEDGTEFSESDDEDDNDDEDGTEFSESDNDDDDDDEEDDD